MAKEHGFKECDTLLSEIENKLLDDARKEKETFRPFFEVFFLHQKFF